jgi:hypothetical protein
MIATIINAAAVILGATLGVVLKSRVRDGIKDVVHTGIGIVSLVIGVSMALEGTRILYLALALVVGGILGHLLGIEAGILKLGDALRRRFTRAEEEGSFASGFLVASVLFCVGAMTIVGSFKAGAEGDYELILTKSVMDGFMAILLAAVMGIGVGFSALTILAYQGGLTLLAGWLRGFVSPLVITEITGVGGALVIMIGLNLLHLREIKTANYIPALVVVLVFVALDPLIGPWVS